MSNHSDNPELSSKTVCVVDDDSSVRSAICSLFRSLSYDVVPFASAFEFLSWIADFHADCLISDVQIPGISGIDMYVRMRAQGREIPTIFITAYPTPDLEAKAVTAGALAFMPKPVNIRALTELVAGSVLRPST
ncbi:two-component sensor histidine kinase bacteria, putative [Ricinus communis]|uniref:Two-component sensor histidine kinase bacteria, putative n=1 Tax=Ricinus communis TaxID=3988 RepID=B9T7I2_RICCO|nr:two-component sensor histidine kinase bacteria, putative [Ricinus communis]